MLKFSIKKHREFDSILRPVVEDWYKKRIELSGKNPSGNNVFYQDIDSYLSHVHGVYKCIKQGMNPLEVWPTPTYRLLGYKQAILVVELWQSVFNHLTLCSVIVGFLNLCRTCATSLSYLRWRRTLINHICDEVMTETVRN